MKDTNKSVIETRQAFERECTKAVIQINRMVAESNEAFAKALPVAIREMNRMVAESNEAFKAYLNANRKGGNHEHLK